MAEKISIEVDLKSQLDELAKLNTSDLKLNKRQKEAFEINKRGAEQALKNNDLKEFRQYFNNMADILKKASIASGKISKNLQELDQRQSEINKKIQSLKETRDSLEKTITTSKGKGTLSKETAKNLLKEYKDKDKIIGKGTDPLQDPAVINQRVQKLAEALGKAGKTWNQLTNEMAQAAGFKDKNAAHAAHRFYDSEQTYITKTQGKIANIDEQIKTEETNATSVSAEIQKIQQEAPEAATALEKLYAAISQIKDEVNTKITDAQSDKRKEEAEKQSGVDIDTKPLSEGLNKQTSALGKAFKQFTLYNIALRAVKTALREAVQTVKELDKYLTEQAMVTGMTREQTYGLVKSYQELALQCGATTKEIAQVSTEYMKQGKTIQESLVLTEAAVKAAKVARVSVGDSVNYLTTALNGFQLSAEDAMKVSDKFAAVAAASATDYDELAIALSKVASQANLAGMSIDYTTALLTKGLETTREAPETMGTALKTIIARMRELSDYGETLEGDTDINNVESQLAYVGIALRDANGELRSTEDVLDELGKKWDTLNKNQQAALAKALAGTRQQSRLIALMDDYERVTELQEISQRSAGATAAQADTYLQGIEASLNNIQVAWEKIVMTITDSEVIIGFLDYIGTTLDNIGEFLATDFGMVALMTTISTIGLSILGNKMREHEVNRRNYLILLKEEKTKKEQEKTEKRAAISEKEKYLNSLKAYKNNLKEYKLSLKDAIVQAQKNKDTALEAKLTAKLAEAEISDAAAQAQIDREIKEVQKEVTTLKQEELLLTTQLVENSVEQFNNSSGLMSTLSSIIPILTVIVGLFSLMNTLQSVGIGLTKLGTIALQKRTKANKIDAAVSTAGAIPEMAKAGAQSGGLPGLIAGLAIALGMAAIVAGIIGGIALGSISIKNAKQEKKNKTADGAAENVNKLSNEIYKLTEKANNLNAIADSFDNIDNKLIKTNKDLKEMNNLLDQTADQLSDEIEEGQDIGYGVNVSEKEYYESFSTIEGRRKALALIEQNNRKEANRLRKEQIASIKKLEGEELKKFLNEETTNSEIRKAQDDIYAYNNNALYEYLDKQEASKEITEAQSNAIETLTQSVLEQLSVEEAWSYAQDETGNKIKTLIKNIQNLKTEVKNLNGKDIELNVAEVLTSDDYTLKEQVQAYTKTLEALEKLNDKAVINAFKENFNQYDYFTTLNDTVLDFVDNVGLSIDKVNELYGSWEKLQKQGVKITQEDWEGNFKFFLTALAETNGNILQATKAIFGNFLDGTDKTLNAFISAYGDVLSVGILNMGQQMDKIQNKINGFYEKALEWGEMNESERSEFLQDNADLFAGDEDLLKAFESGNYDKIEDALASSQNFQKQIEDQKEKIRLELLIEEARPEEEKNKAYIKELKRYQEYLSDAENLFKASLEIRLEQEQKQLDEYRSYLEDQQQALEDSLNKRKEAYEKYFDSISEEEEAEEYDEQANLLIGNINKLASSSNASSVQKTKELEQQLKELEKERLKELRERAQEKILEKMDTDLEEISKKFDKLLESNQALLVALNGELKDPLNFFAELIGNKIEKGSTMTEIQDFIGGLQTTYGAALDKDIDWDAIKVHEENNQLFLTVNGKEIALDTNNEQNLYQAIMKALTEIGLR